MRILCKSSWAADDESAAPFRAPAAQKPRALRAPLRVPLYGPGQTGALLSLNRVISARQNHGAPAAIERTPSAIRALVRSTFQHRCTGLPQFSQEPLPNGRFYRFVGVWSWEPLPSLLPGLQEGRKAIGTQGYGARLSRFGTLSRAAVQRCLAELLSGRPPGAPGVFSGCQALWGRLILTSPSAVTKSPLQRKKMC